MRTGAVAAGDEGVLAVGDGGEGREDILGILHARGIILRAAEDEVVVHVCQTLGIHAVDHTREARVHKGLFLGLGVHEQQVGVAHLGGGDRLAGAGGVDLDLIAVLVLEHRQQIAQQARVVHARGGGHADDLRLLGGGGDLRLGDRAVVLQIEQVVAVLLLTEFRGGSLTLLAQQPVDERVGAGGVELHVADRVAVGVGKGRIGIDRQQRVVVDHAFVLLHEDDGVQLDGRLRRGLGRGALDGLVCGARAQREHHQHRQKQGQILFHGFVFLLFQR